MTTALSASLLADMTEQDKIGLAKQLSMTSAAALDDANLEAARRASRQEALRSEMAAIEQKEIRHRAAPISRVPLQTAGERR